ncbi:hypothetical protein, partial [Aquitalea magnusonii]|uniref:hypothetical protein n=1 Tax=Aquitalea magnusonii TaxID=332411 RepID=UPI00128EDFFE
LDDAATLAIAAALEQASEHPVAQALKLAAADLPLPATERLDDAATLAIAAALEQASEHPVAQALKLAAADL